MSLESRFWAKVLKTDECWLWQANKTKKGYGLLGLGKRGEGVGYAHRISWEIHNGPIPEGKNVCHACDIPGCVRPDHLFLGSQQENMTDMSTKGRRGKTGPKAGSGSKNPLTKEQVKEIHVMSKTLSQQKLAERFGVGQSTISRILRGESCSEIV